MTYLEIRDLIIEKGLETSISLDIVSCVIASLPGPVSDENFTEICKYVRFLWDDVEKTYTQLIADVVVDCIYHCFDYWECKDINLDLNNLEFNHEDNIYLQVRDAYLTKYYN